MSSQHSPHARVPSGRPGRRWALLAAPIAGLLALSACGSPPAKSSGHASTAATTDALVAAAKKEGSLTVYASTTDAANQEVAAAFKRKYGVTVKIIRLVTSNSITRFSAEAKAGNPGADLLLLNLSAFNEQAIKAGMLTDLNQAKIPDFPPAGYPSSFVRAGSGTLVVELQVRGIAYNTDKVKGADVPKTWTDILNPKWKGRIGVADPKSSPVYVAEWYTIGKSISPQFLNQVGKQQLKVYASGAPAVDALAAGEIDINPMTIGDLLTADKTKGAPIGFVIPDTTSADELTVNIAAKAKHPNAARLFAQYIASKSGSELLAGASNDLSPYDSAKLPPHYLTYSPDIATTKRSQVLSQLNISAG